MINIDFASLAKTIGAFLTKNWQGVCLVIALAFILLTRNDYASLKKSMDAMSESYEEQIQKLQEIHIEELRRKEEAILNYQKEIEDLNKKYTEASEELEKSKEEKKEEFKNDFKNEPSKIINELEQRFGIKYVD